LKYIVTLLALFIGGLLAGTFNNMYKYGYGVNDAFWRIAWAIDEGTIWAPNFSEENFDKLKIGMTDKEVLLLMGKPLNALEETCVNSCFWFYTKQDSGTSDFDQRWVVFNRDKRVSEIRKSFFID
jgi:SmpA / OmlA family